MRVFIEYFPRLKSCPPKRTLVVPDSISVARGKKVSREIFLFIRMEIPFSVIPDK